MLADFIPLLKSKIQRFQNLIESRFIGASGVLLFCFKTKQISNQRNRFLNPLFFKYQKCCFYNLFYPIYCRSGAFKPKMNYKTSP
jgi:hypothetical protein